MLQVLVIISLISGVQWRLSVMQGRNFRKWWFRGRHWRTKGCSNLPKWYLNKNSYSLIHSKGRELHCANGTSFLLAIMLSDLCASLYLHFVEHSNGTVINTVYSSWNYEHFKNVNCKSIRNRLTLIHIYLLHVLIKFFAFLSNLFHLTFYTNITYSYL